ncbi:hypothetical protein ABZ863_08285 [Saccharomonospora sp. NPDC046836]|uniref:hypothetical protein n=1 Tax=Saccharomonospora sp. NPDC046836 TaxID=3156921 RepID=UPI0034105ED4
MVRLLDRVHMGGQQIELPALGTVHVPAPEHIVYYAGLGLLAALGFIEWPVAVVIGAGHLLADQHWSHVVTGIGEVLEEA